MEPTNSIFSINPLQGSDPDFRTTSSSPASGTGNQWQNGDGTFKDQNSSQRPIVEQPYKQQPPSLASQRDTKDYVKYGKKSNSVERNLVTPLKKKSPVEAEYSLRISPTLPESHINGKRITANALPPKIGRKKSSSISTFTTPDGVTVSIQVMMQCLSRAVWYEIRANEFDFGVQVDVFCEDSHSFIPSMQTLEKFFTLIFNTKSLSIECAVTAVAYVDKLRRISNVKLNRINWKRICFIAILEADKVLRDKLVWNEDYKDIIPGIDLDLLRKLERAFLKYIEFSLTLSQADYAAYLLDLLSLRNKDLETPQEKHPRIRTGSHGVEPIRREEERLELNKSM